MFKRIAVGVTWCVIAACAGVTTRAEAPAGMRRPNVLWLIAEDLGPDLSCYGEPEVYTPRIDSIADAGMRFTRAFTVAPVCSTSRSAFMTGMYACSINAQNHRSHHKGDPDGPNFLPDGVEPLPIWLQKAGYFTANVRTLDDSDPNSWYRGTGKDDWNFSCHGKAWQSGDWNDLKSHQPFYAQVNFSETHRGPDWDHAKQHIDHPADPSRVVIPPYLPDHPVTRADWAQYLDCAMALDKKVGFVLDLLKRDHLDKNTVVIFIGDHGRAMVRAKQWLYDPGLHIPLLILWPSDFPAPPQYHAGTVSNQPIESIDLAATTLWMAGVAKPAKMQGRVFMGPHADPPRRYTFGTRDRCDETVFHIRSVRDERFRYIRNDDWQKPFLLLNRYKETEYPVITLLRYLDEHGELTGPPKALLAAHRPKEELYDHRHDPDEVHNVADDPAYHDDLVRLRRVLDRWIDAVHDDGQTPEPPTIPAYWDAQMKKRYEDTGRMSRAKARYLEEIKAAEAEAKSAK